MRRARLLNHQCSRRSTPIDAEREAIRRSSTGPRHREHDFCIEHPGASTETWLITDLRARYGANALDNGPTTPAADFRAAACRVRQPRPALHEALARFRHQRHAPAAGARQAHPAPGADRPVHDGEEPRRPRGERARRASRRASPRGRSSRSSCSASSTAGIRPPRRRSGSSTASPRSWACSRSSRRHRCRPTARDRTRSYEEERKTWHPDDVADPRFEHLMKRYGWLAAGRGLTLRPRHHINILSWLDAIDPEFAGLWVRFCYQGMYGRDVLDPRTRLLCVVGNCLAIGEVMQSRGHMRGAHAQRRDAARGDRGDPHDLRQLRHAAGAARAGGLSADPRGGRPAGRGRQSAGAGGELFEVSLRRSASAPSAAPVPSSPASPQDASQCGASPSRSAAGRAAPPLRPKRSRTWSGCREIR